MVETGGAAVASSRPQRIGVLCIGRPQWVAGLVYTQNLVGSLATLPDRERPEVHLFAGPRFRRQDLRDLSGGSSATSYTQRSLAAYAVRCFGPK